MVGSRDQTKLVDGVLKQNKLVTPGALELGEDAIDLGAVKTPVMVVSLKDDHVSAWEATYDGARMFGGEVRFQGREMTGLAAHRIARAGIAQFFTCTVNARSASSAQCGRAHWIRSGSSSCRSLR